MESTTIVALIVFIICDCNVSCAPLTDGEGVEQDDINGEVLEKLGEKLKLPTLQVIGRAIENVEREIEDKICDLHRCTSWTEWQGCNARPGQFGSKFRTRQCGVNATTCELDSNNKPDKESSICIGFCPKDYNVTKKGYCIKLYTDQGRNQDDAEQRCKKDGGHLINIDSEVKYEDVNSMLQGLTKGDFWLDGRRNDGSLPWEFTYGSPKGFFKWCSTCPSNTAYDLGLYAFLSGGTMFMDDAAPKHSSYSLCEMSELML